MVLDAVDEDGRRKLATKSNEAFGLLLIDNYIDKWSISLTNVARVGTTTEKDADAVSVADPGNDNNKNIGAETDRTKMEEKEKKGQERLPEGTKHLNEFQHLVQEDRASKQS